MDFDGEAWLSNVVERHVRQGTYDRFKIDL
jgi:hypothetical protein